MDTSTEYVKAANNPEDRFIQPNEDIIYFNERFLNSEAKVMFRELDIPISIDELTTTVK